MAHIARAPRVNRISTGLFAKVSVAQLARECGLSEADVRLGLDEAVKAGYLRVVREGEYEATLPETKPPAGKAGGSDDSGLAATTPIGNHASQGGRNAK